MEETKNYIHCVENADGAVFVILKQILDFGNKVTTPASDKRGSFREVTHSQFIITNPIDRIIQSNHYDFDLITAVARFVWLVGKNDRLEDIAFYQPRVREYTDDGLVVPGSDYGKRILNPYPGVNQLTSVIEHLRNVPHSRRAYVAIWEPQDAMRLTSKDLPCATALQFLIRDNKLESTLIMRSNNAFSLLPFNIFEFSLFGEMVATELGIKYGQYYQNSTSMHLFDKHQNIANDMISDYKNSPKTSERLIMPKMPPNPIEQATTLAQLEASLRNQSVLEQPSKVYSILSEAEEKLNEYWLEFFKVLCIGAFIHARDYQNASDLAKGLKPYFRKLLTKRLELLLEQENISKVSKPKPTLDYYTDNATKFHTLKKIYASEEVEKPSIAQAIEKRCTEIEKEKHTMILRNEFVKLLIIFTERTFAAGRSDGPETKDPEDMRNISTDEVWAELKKIRSGLD